MRVLIIPLLLIAMAAFSLDTQVIPDSDLRKRVPMTTVIYQDSALTRPFEHRTLLSLAKTSPFWLKVSDGGRSFLLPYTACGKPIRMAAGRIISPATRAAPEWRRALGFSFFLLMTAEGPFRFTSSVELNTTAEELTMS